MALEPDRHREIIPTSYFATGNGGNGRNEGGNGRNGRNEKMEEIVAETASRISASDHPWTRNLPLLCHYQLCRSSYLLTLYCRIILLDIIPFIRNRYFEYMNEGI